jgi:hypothetical protein
MTCYFCEVADSSENLEKSPNTPQVAETTEISLETSENVPLHPSLIFFECITCHITSHSLCCTHIDTPLEDWNEFFHMCAIFDFCLSREVVFKARCTHLGGGFISFDYFKNDLSLVSHKCVVINHLKGGDWKNI